jgi:hypothetical protein
LGVKAEVIDIFEYLGNNLQYKLNTSDEKRSDGEAFK